MEIFLYNSPNHLAAANIVREHDNIQTILGGLLYELVCGYVIFFQEYCSLLSVFPASTSNPLLPGVHIVPFPLYDHVSLTSLEHFT